MNWNLPMQCTTCDYRPQRSCGKVIFSQASLHSVHGGAGVCPSACWDTPPQADTPQTDTAADGTHSYWKAFLFKVGSHVPLNSLSELP